MQRRMRIVLADWCPALTEAQVSESSRYLVLAELELIDRERRMIVLEELGNAVDQIVMASPLPLALKPAGTGSTKFDAYGTNGYYRH